MSKYWPEGEDLDLLGYEAAFEEGYEAAFEEGYEAAAFGDDSEATRRRRARARSRGSRPRRSRPRYPTPRPRPQRLDDFPQTPATVQNIDDDDGGDIDDDYDGGDIDDGYGGEDDYAELAEELREVVHEDYEDAPPEEMQEALISMLETMTPAEGFSFTKVLKGLGTVFPQAGAIAGTALVPGIGTVIGGKLGQVAGQALSGKGKPGSAPAPANTAPASPKDGSAAAAKIVALTQNKDVGNALLALALGELGKQSIPIGKDGQSVPVAAVVDLLKTLVSQAAEDAEELVGETDERLPYYMLDSAGEFQLDPVDPLARADALYQALLDAQNQRLADEAALYEAYLEFDAASDGDEYDEEALDDYLY